MSLRLRLLNLYLRNAVKPSLARVKTPQAARRHLERAAAPLLIVVRGVRISEERIDTPGGPMPLEWVTAGRADRRRIILYLHGGAYIMGNPRTHRTVTAALAKATGARVAVPDYRLAPEHPCPAAVEDALCAYAALLRQGYAPEQIAFAGESAGGGLVFATLLLAQQKKFPMPSCVVAYSPWVDLTGEAASLSENAAREVTLPASRAAEASAYYVGEGDARDPLASPVFGSYSAPPPALIFGSQAEILRDDSVAMAAHWQGQGGVATLEMHPSAPHAWPFFAPLIPEGAAAVAQSARFIAEAMREAE